MNQEHSAFIGVCILCAVVSVMLWLFFSYHLWLVSIGFTTNENSKYSSAGYYLERSINFYSKWEDIKKSKDGDFTPSQKTLDFYGAKAEMTLNMI